MIRKLLARLASTPRASLAPPRERLVIDPDRGPIYAIGDVHGCFDLLMDAERRIAADRQDQPATIVMLGDYVDRGPRSADVLDHLRRPAPPGIERVCLVGNHDETMLRFIRNPADNMEWLEFGGDTTLRSYGLDIVHLMRHMSADGLAAVLAEAIPDSHLAFLAGLPVAATAGGHIFVHAGVRPGIALDDQDDEDLMWIREPFLSGGPQLPVTVVHGHTPVREPTPGPGRIGIDTGAYLTGCLTVLKIDKGAATVLR